MSNDFSISKALLVADAGGTSVTWHLHVITRTDNTTLLHQYSAISPGINAVHTPEEEIHNSLSTAIAELNRELSQNNLPKCRDLLSTDNATIRFYGAGCSLPSAIDKIKNNIHSFTQCPNVLIETDLLGAAHAALGDDEGIIAILGTGSNSGYYDGKQIIANTPPLGFILGDEGSGAYIGKRFLSDLFKGLTPPPVSELYHYLSGMEMPQVIDAVYRQPMPAKFLGSQTRYLNSILRECQKNPTTNRDAIIYLEDLLVDCFSIFFKRNFVQYYNLPCAKSVSLIGSVAYVFSQQLKIAAANNGYTIKSILKNPGEELLRYNIKHYEDS